MVAQLKAQVGGPVPSVPALDIQAPKLLYKTLCTLQTFCFLQGLNPYLIPVGGSNALGTWGYLQAVEEIRQQTQGWGITDIAMVGGLRCCTALTRLWSTLGQGVYLASMQYADQGWLVWLLFGMWQQQGKA